MTARKTQANPCPLPIPTTQVARGLIRIHSRLRGELIKGCTDEAPLVGSSDAQKAMAHIEGVLDFLGVDFVPARIKPVVTRVRIGPLNHGELRAEILAVLRTAADWRTYDEVAQTIVVKRRLTLDQPQHRHFLQKLREATHALVNSGVLERESNLELGGHQPQPQRLRLSTTLFRPR